MSVSPDEARSRGRIEQRGDSLRVIVYTGIDPVTGKRSYLRETIKGTDKAAHRRANSRLGKLIAQVDEQRSTQSSVPLGHVIDEWLRDADLEDGTREMSRATSTATSAPSSATAPSRRSPPAPSKPYTPNSAAAESAATANPSSSTNPGATTTAKPRNAAPTSAGPRRLHRPPDPRRSLRCALRRRPLGMALHQPPRKSPTVPSKPLPNPTRPHPPKLPALSTRRST